MREKSVSIYHMLIDWVGQTGAGEYLLRFPSILLARNKPQLLCTKLGWVEIADVYMCGDYFHLDGLGQQGGMTHQQDVPIRNV